MSTYTHARRITAVIFLAVVFSTASIVAQEQGGGGSATGMLTGALGSASRAASRAVVDFAAKSRSWRDKTFKGFRMGSCQAITFLPPTERPDGAGILDVQTMMRHPFSKSITAIAIAVMLGMSATDRVSAQARTAPAAANLGLTDTLRTTTRMVTPAVVQIFTTAYLPADTVVERPSDLGFNRTRLRLRRHRRPRGLHRDQCACHSGCAAADGGGARRASGQIDSGVTQPPGERARRRHRHARPTLRC